MQNLDENIRDKKLGINKNSLYLIFSCATIFSCLIMASCIYPTYKHATDPASDTKGYKLCTAKTGGYHISFEYPDTWRRTQIGRSVYNYNIFYLFSPDVYLRIWVDKKLEGETAETILQDVLKSAPKFDGKINVSYQGKVNLRQVIGYEAVYSYKLGFKDAHAPAPFVNMGDTVIDDTVSVEYKNQFYVVNMVSSENKFNSNKSEFDHLIHTLEFLN